MTLGKSNNRQAGVLLHITSLPSGDLGSDAYRFIDFLACTGTSIWQTLPINMPHADNSPYQCVSAHAGNPDFISSQALVEEGLLNTDEKDLPRDQLFNIAYNRFIERNELNAFSQFSQTHQAWLEDFALYLCLRRQFAFSGWHTWPDEFKNRDEMAMAKIKKDLANEINVIKFTQFLFFKQWDYLKEYAHQKQVQLFGDIPIFVAYDSADVWAQPNLFKLNENKEMSVVAGVPPDYFSETGQRWGNPHYNWPEMAKNNYAWWLARIETQTHLFDMIRIDHFRGLEAAWEIPANDDNAINGTWVDAPGDALLASIKERFPNIQLIAEDLGIITPEVDALRTKYALPGMNILHFAFGGDADNPYLPNNVEENSVTYTGTHDNDTTLGWYQSISEDEQQNVNEYISLNHASTPLDMPFSLINVALSTISQFVIIPMQDILELDASSRMNVPGTSEGNWLWRFSWDQLNASQINQFSEAIQRHGRTV
ncbi:MAG: 4-alpha-glucanotransferase [Methylophilaceae bacterium]